MRRTSSVTVKTEGKEELCNWKQEGKLQWNWVRGRLCPGCRLGEAGDTNAEQDLWNEHPC